MLSARLPGSPAGANAPPGAPQDGKAPATPAQQSAQPSGNSPGPTAPLSPVATPSQDAAVSFDDFFGAAAGGSGAPNSTEAGKDDLDQFQSWLQNLKR
jgi:hypothetical protein